MYDFDVILSFLTAFTLTYFAIPSIIAVARKKNLCDEPGERRSHTVSTPSLGGIAIFAGVLFAILLWTPFQDYAVSLQYVLCSFVIIFLIGAKDDIDPVAPSTKLIGQVLAATILVFKADVRITGLYGMFGVEHLPFWVSVPLSIFIIIVIINAFNLIDGINGLSGSIATLIAGILGTWFLLIRRYDLAIMAFSMAGAVIAFLKYNYSPARIFMGDTGSLLIGLICAILSIQFIELDSALPLGHPHRINAAPAVAIGILIFPLCDTLRVFVTRVARGRSPLSPDRNHIHHLLIDTGFSHTQATLTLVFVNLLFIILTLYLQNFTDALPLAVFLLAMAMLLATSLYYTVKRRELKKRLS